MSGLTAAAEPTDWPRSLVAIAFGAFGLFIGVRAWQGRWPGPGGPRPRYQTYFGAAHGAAGVGLWMVLLGTGEVVRGALHLDSDGAFFMTVSIITTAVCAVVLLYLFAYFWTGVPPWMRPPHQRHQRALGEGSFRARLARLKDHR